MGATLRLGLLLPLILGGCLFVHFNEKFVFAYQQQYTFFGWIAFFALWLPVAVLLRRQKVQEPTHRVRTRWISRLVMFPVCVSLACATVVVAPLGWFAAGIWMFGAKRVDVPAKVLHVEDYQIRKYCHQNVELQILRVEARACLPKVFKGHALQAGNVVNVRGRELASGFIIELIELP